MRLWPVAVVLCALVFSASASGQRVTFSSRRDEVHVDVLVTDHGKLVRNLKASDFEVFDNGVRQDVDLATVEVLPINAIVTLDLSGSVIGDRLDNLRRAGHALIGALQKDDRAAVISFSHVVDVGKALTADLPSVLASIDRMRAGGGTSLRDAAQAALLMGETDVGRSLAIVFSDAVDTLSWLTPEAVLDTARRSKTVVYGVTVVGSRPGFLRQLTAETGGSILQVESTKDLDEAFVKVLAEFRERYLIGYSPKGVQKDGRHRIDVRIKGRGGLTVKHRPGYVMG